MNLTSKTYTQYGIHGRKRGTKSSEWSVSRSHTYLLESLRSQQAIPARGAVNVNHISRILLNLVSKQAAPCLLQPELSGVRGRIMY
jgi:hypothetical protein